MYAIGIDPSLTNTGVVTLGGGLLRAIDNIKSKKSGDTPTDEMLRLTTIVDDLVRPLPKNTTGLVAIEGLAFAARNTSSLSQLSGLNYMLRDAILNRDDLAFKLIVVAPTSLKKFVTGKGNCQKDLMFLKTYKRWKLTFTDNNLCDAHGLARIAEAVLNPGVKLTRPQQEVVTLVKKQL